MRVFYVVKALQIVVAAVVIFRLLHIGNFCETRHIHSRSECLGAMKLAIPPLNSDLSIGDAEKAATAGRLIRPRRTVVILTKKDLTLEEVHEENTRRRKGMLNSLEEPKQEKVAKTEDLSKAIVAPKAESHVAHNDSASVPPKAKVEPIVENDKDRDEKHVTEEVKRRIIKKAVRIEPLIERESKEADDKAEQPPKSDTPEAKEHSKPETPKEHSKPETPQAEGQSKPKTPEAKEHSKEEKVVKDQHDLKTIEIKKENSKEKETNVKPTVEKEKIVAKAATLKPAEKVTEHVPTRPPTVKLVNTVLNCLESSVQDVLGFGDIDLSQSFALRLPLACLIVSMIGTGASMVHTFTNLSRPRRCRTFLENVAQIVLWSVSGFALFLLRQDWETTWNNSSAGTFEPDYPTAWYCSELICYVMIVVFLIETYFYDYCFYKIYVEESVGNYTVVDRPDYGNSIYSSTLEPTENIAL
ncbi:hypothetical protein RB195_005588 [Necator americanus]|uniref:Synaptophysin / synaptoporin n=1 Tax=Necator americanus TaxID=51031 RepID=A0ABR1BQ61_NECAM